MSANLAIPNSPAGAGSSPSPLFAIGQRIGFWHGTRKTSAVIYDVGLTMYCVTAWFGRNYMNLGIDHDSAWLANAAGQAITRIETQDIQNDEK